ncbi:hypothetical protein JOC75_004027 [Metabacillus crassostreae]|uniref:hypothetical protein n=1 Tax=Metabacillus crassostreae TaxID=929098 RepID=UPI00195A3559|nr:hypothetical protein [Metabacillus crassostreae]MBM7605999.1 hypothetical protein [Metabacillus crassostreae]
MLLGAIATLLISLVLFLVYAFQAYNPGTLTINAPFNLGNYQFEKAKLTEKELDISWKLYVQLTTRKAAIPIDEENDIITEVYDSWYELFKSTREYLIELPASEIQGNENAQEIVRLSLDVLNKGMRPHLTKWQGKYRKWYEIEVQKEENQHLTPQELQRKYKYYGEMVDEIKIVNKELNEYANQLKRFSHEETPNVPTKVITRMKDFMTKFKNEDKVSK